MLKELIKNNFRYFCKDFRISKKNTAKENLKGYVTILGIAILAVSFAMMYYASFYESAAAFSSYNLGWLYFSYAGLSIMAIIIFFSITMCISYLFESKDDEILLTMPIDKEDILVSRFSIVFVFIYAITFVCLIPTFIAWLQFNQLPFLGYINFVLCLLTYPLLPIGVSALIAYIINKVSKKTGHKNAIKFIFTILIIIVYELVVGNISYGLEYVLDNYGIVSNVARYLIPLSWFGRGVASGNILAAFGFVAINVLGFYLIIKFLARRYFGLLSSSYNYKFKKYVEKHEKTKSITATLLKKEINVMTKTFIWAINWMTGLVIIIVGLIVVLFSASKISYLLNSLDIELQYLQIRDMISLLAVLAICFMLSTVIVTCCSISFEGKKLWILKTSPVSSEDVLLVKVFAQLIFTLPVSILSGITIVAIIKPTFTTCFNVFLILIGFALTNAMMGAYLNCKHPMLDWVNEQQPAKQSAAVLLALVLPLLFFAAIFCLYYFILRFAGVSIVLYGGIVAALIGVSCIFSYVLLMDSGKKAFERLN